MYPQKYHFGRERIGLQSTVPSAKVGSILILLPLS